MPKKMKILIPVVLSIFLVTIFGSVAVMADDGSTPTPPVQKGLLARVAEILQIPLDKLIGAFKQARQEMHQEIKEKVAEKVQEKRHIQEEKIDELFNRYVEKALERNLIDEAEASEIREWWEDRPEALDKLMPMKLPMPGIMKEIGGKWDELFKRSVEKAREKELISEDEADEILTWWEDRPEALDKVIPKLFTPRAIKERLPHRQSTIQKQSSPVTPLAIY